MTPQDKEIQELRRKNQRLEKQHQLDQAEIVNLRRRYEVRCRRLKADVYDQAVTKATKARENQYTDDTLRRTKKETLIEYIRLLERNYDTAVQFNERQARNVEILLTELRTKPLDEAMAAYEKAVTGLDRREDLV